MIGEIYFIIIRSSRFSFMREPTGTLTIEETALTIYYSDQCPYAINSLEIIRQVCGEARAPYSLVPVDTLEKAKALPCVFNNYAVFYGGAFQTVNLLDAASLRRLLGTEHGRGFARERNYCRAFGSE